MTSINSSRASNTTEPPLSSQSSTISSVNDQIDDEEQYPGGGSPTSLHVIVNDEDQNGETAGDELQSPRKSNIIRDWWQEVLGALFSLGCAVAIIAILFSTQEQPRSYWSFRISPNALVAIFSTLSKAALLMPVASCISQLKWVYFMKNPHPLADIQAYDDASRGPWGSLNLLWTTKGKRLMAAWGAFITILALGMEPFVQAIIVYPQRKISSESRATFGSARTYDSGADYRMGFTAEPSEAMMDPSIQGAILSGVYNLDSPIKVQCPTGTCTWPKFTTLAVCSSCRNVTSETRVDCWSPPQHYDIFCNYTTPAGFKLEATSHPHFGIIQGGYTEYNSTGKVPRPMTIDPLNTTLVSFASANNFGNNNIRKPKIVIECDISWCAQTFHNLSVTNGTFSAGLITEIPLKSRPDSDQESLCPLIPSSLNPDVVGNDTFIVNPTDSGNIGDYLFNILTSTGGSDYGNLLMTSSNLSETVANITQSITYALGVSNSSNETLGTALTTQPYIHVRWPFITFPLSVIVIGIAFLIWTLVYISFNKPMAWKSSNIVPLLARTELRDETMMSLLHSESGITARAREIHGRLEMRESGNLVFVQCGVGEREF